MTEKELARLMSATQHGLEEAHRITLNRIAEDRRQRRLRGELPPLPENEERKEIPSDIGDGSTSVR